MTREPPPPYVELDCVPADGRASPIPLLADGDRLVVLTPPPSPSPPAASAAAHASQQPPQTKNDNYYNNNDDNDDDGDPLLVHDLPVLVATTAPAALPLPAALATRGVGVDDWRAFVEQLLPGGAIQESKGSVSTDSTDRADQIRLVDNDNDNDKSNPPPPQHLAATVRQWNASFFGPRGIVLRMGGPAAVGGPAAGAAVEDLLGVPREWQRQRQLERRTVPLQRAVQDTHTPSFRDVVQAATDVARAHGGRRTGMLASSLAGLVASRGEKTTEDAVEDRGVGALSLDDTQPPVYAAPTPVCEKQAPPTARSRAFSISSVSSTSSSASSTASSASVGSLPPYDTLPTDLLPTARALLQHWLDHPDVPATRADVQAAAAWLKAHPAAAAVAAAPSADPDKAALRTELLLLHRRWRTLKREQQRARRQARKAAHKQQRAARKEARQARRQARRDRRQARRGAAAAAAATADDEADPPPTGGYGVPREGGGPANDPDRPAAAAAAAAAATTSTWRTVSGQLAGRLAVRGRRSRRGRVAGLASGLVGMGVAAVVDGVQRRRAAAAAAAAAASEQGATAAGVFAEENAAARHGDDAVKGK